MLLLSGVGVGVGSGSGFFETVTVLEPLKYDASSSFAPVAFPLNEMLIVPSPVATQFAVNVLLVSVASSV